MAEVRRGVDTGWVAALCLAVAGTFAGWYGPLQILLARQAEAFADKETVLAVVTLVGALASVVANPIWGALSDRSGRRTPWLVVGTLGGVAGLVVLALAGDFWVVLGGWCLVQVALNASLAALSAAIPDHVPVERRGSVGGLFGLGQVVGVMTGTGLAVVGGSVLGGYLACAGFVLLSAVPYVLKGRDGAPRTRSTKVKLTRDFRWAWITRFLMNLANALVLLYLYFYLKDAVGLADPGSGVFILTVANAVTLLITVVIGGVWSDRVGKRRVFVLVSGLIMSVAALLLVGQATWPVAILAATVLGLGFGVYTAVDFALLTEVLPTEGDRGRDLGVLNIAAALPQVVAPGIAAPVVRHLGGYPVLYAVAALLGVLGSVLVYRIKTVR